MLNIKTENSKINFVYASIFVYFSSISLYLTSFEFPICFFEIIYSSEGPICFRKVEPLRTILECYSSSKMLYKILFAF